MKFIHVISCKVVTFHCCMLFHFISIPQILTVEHFGCSQFGIITNNAAINIILNVKNKYKVVPWLSGLNHYPNTTLTLHYFSDLILATLCLGYYIQPYQALGTHQIC